MGAYLVVVSRQASDPGAAFALRSAVARCREGHEVTVCFVDAAFATDATAGAAVVGQLLDHGAVVWVDATNRSRLPDQGWVRLIDDLTVGAAMLKRDVHVLWC